MLTIVGPTASGKTALAVLLANLLNGEIISADSRQVYKGMTIGTGKDLEEYNSNGIATPYHLIDIVNPGYEYNVFEFQKDFLKVYSEINSRGKLPILCGGSGMYLESVLKGYRMKQICSAGVQGHDLEDKSYEELSKILSELRTPHNTTDLLDRRRMIKAILISRSGNEEMEVTLKDPGLIFGILWERSALRERITSRLGRRLEAGLTEEVRNLLDSGLTPGQLKFYGLEYRYVTQYILNEISYGEMFRLLNIAIHQFAKRQMTWFRKMERSGLKINWIPGELQVAEQAERVMGLLSSGVKE